jgi:phosphohistidine swiveling domain-containing protein
MTSRRVYSLRRRRLPARIGTKARNLGFLFRHGFAVPAGYVCSPAACAAGQARALRRELEALLVAGRSYAVRSCANIEDGASHSFAGQFRTVLGVWGLEEGIAAIGEVCGSARAPEVLPYLHRAGRPGELPAMAVIVQEMVPAVFSGVAFSKNPITGLAEVVIEAVAGSGERLVQEGVTPERWVSKWGWWQSRPREGQLPVQLAEQIVRQTLAIARAFGRPADLEWVYDGSRLWWVQLRAITTSGELNVYSDHIAREMLPGQIKPLVWSINIPLVNTAWVRILTELIGPNDIDPLRLARQFHYRTYFNMGEIGRVFEALGMPQDSLELMMGVRVEGSDRPRMMPSARAMRHAGRMLRFIWDKWRFDRRTDRFLPEARAWYAGFRSQGFGGLAEPGLLDAVDRLFQFTLRTAYFNVVAPLLMLFYNRLLRKGLERGGVDFAAVDVTRGLAELAELDPKPHLARLAAALNGLDPQCRRRVLDSRGIALEAVAGAEDFSREFAGFLERFGHMSDSGVDFSHVPWREDPGRVLGLIAGFQPAGGLSSFEDIPRRRRRRLRLIYRRARQFRLCRERISSLYSYGYGTFRDLFLELGRRFVAAGRLGEASDIFYLFLPEVRRAVKDPGMDVAALAAVRQAEMAACADARLPSVIFGDDPPRTDRAGEGALQGVPTSRGRYRGPARVIRDTAEFPRLQPGDVLVIPFSDVGWTPLFAKAGAVVAESGGILSHSSIVAREYGIPAVVSVQGAMDLEDGVTVEVDGYTGQVFVRTQKGENS